MMMVLIRSDLLGSSVWWLSWLRSCYVLIVWSAITFPSVLHWASRDVWYIYNPLLFSCYLCSPLVQASQPLPYLESLKRILAQLLGPNSTCTFSLSSVSLGAFILYSASPISNHDMLHTWRTHSAVSPVHTLSISDALFMCRCHPSQIPSWLLSPSSFPLCLQILLSSSSVSSGSLNADFLREIATGSLLWPFAPQLLTETRSDRHPVWVRD